MEVFWNNVLETNHFAVSEKRERLKDNLCPRGQFFSITFYSNSQKFTVTAAM